MSRWIAQVLASASFWALRSEWTDLHQEATGRLIESLRAGRYDPAMEAKAYVQGVARKTALKALTRQIRVASTKSDDFEVEQSPDTGAGETRVLQKQLARQVLDLATEACRDLIVSYFMEGRSYEELSEDSGSPVGTIKSRLFRCLEAAHQAIVGRKGLQGARRRAPHPPETPQRENPGTGPEFSGIQ